MVKIRNIVSMVDTLEDIAVTLTKCCEFLDATFYIGSGEGDAGVMSPLRKAVLTTWTLYYRSAVNVPGGIVQRLLPSICHNKVVDPE